MYIYKTTNLVNGKIYIGQKMSEPSKSTYYIGSGVKLVNAIKKYGKSNFVKEILCECQTQVELNAMEKHYIKLFNSQDNSIGYNILEGGEGFGRNLQVPWNKGRIGVYTEEQLANYSNAAKNRKIDPVNEHIRRNKIGDSRRGVQLPETWKKNISISRKNMSESEKVMLSNRMKHRHESGTGGNYKKIQDNDTGIVYNSIKDCMAALNISWHIYTKLFKEGKFNNI